MNSESVRVVLVAALALALSTVPACAQFESMMTPSEKPLRFWIGGGVSVPVSGDFKEAFDTGFNGRGMVTYKPAGFPIGVRLDLSFQKFALSSIQVGGTGVPVGEEAATQMFSALGNAVYTLPLGAFRIKTELDDPELIDDDPQVEFGINAAADFQLSLSRSLTLFAEGRLDNVYTDDGAIAREDIQVVPVTFGIVF